jgi:triosephosphate isomerase
MLADMRRKIIAGNWKMNGTAPETEKLLSELLADDAVGWKAQVVVCPPFTSLPLAAKILSGSRIALGAQDMSQHEKGAYTGEVSGAMLLTVGATFVILGHSERRQYHAETSALVAAKAKLALKLGLTPIVCIGETLAEREAGKTETVLADQVAQSLFGFSADDLGRTVVAYEPVWAIGTGKTASPEMAEEAQAFVRTQMSKIDSTTAKAVPILYGGSVKADNAPTLLRQPNIDGALVGGASLVAKEFLTIVHSV